MKKEEEVGELLIVTLPLLGLYLAMFNATVRSVADPGEGQGNQCLDDPPPPRI